MNQVTAWVVSAAGRRWLYGVTAAGIAVAAGYQLIGDGEAPLWLALAASLLGVAAPVTALRNITPDPVPDDPAEGLGDE